MARHLSVPTVLGTILVLSAIQVVSASPAAAGRVGGALQGLGTAARYLMSPSVPLIPDRRPLLSKAYGPPLKFHGDLPTSLLPPVQG